MAGSVTGVSAKFGVGIAAIVRDEAPYLLEWVAWHRMLGVEHFVIADHGSVDGTTHMLNVLQEAGLVTLIRLERDALAPQLGAYERILAERGARFGWLGFLDADEFVVPEPHVDLPTLLREQPADVGGVALNWATYGSSFQPVPDNDQTPSPTLRRFGWRAQQDVETNRHVKCFVRPHAARINGRGAKVHAFALTSGLRYVWPDGTPDPVPADGSHGQSGAVRWQGARLNHYTTRSRWEFDNRKRPRGDALQGGERPAEFFAHHDLNDVFDPVRPQLLASFEGHQRRLAKTLRKGGYTPTPGTMPPMPEWYATAEEAKVHYGLDRGLVCMATGRRYVEGWGFNNAGATVMTTMDLSFGREGRTVQPDVVVTIPRPDVLERYPQAPRLCGFRIYLPSLPIGPDEGLPVYDSGQHIETLPASLFQTVERMVTPEDTDAADRGEMRLVARTVDNGRRRFRKG